MFFSPCELMEIRKFNIKILNLEKNIRRFYDLTCDFQLPNCKKKKKKKNHQKPNKVDFKLGNTFTEVNKLAM